MEFNAPRFPRDEKGEFIAVKFTEVCDLLGFSRYASREELISYGVEMGEDVTGEIPTIFLCEEAINSLQASLYADATRSAEAKTIISDRFWVGISNQYFTPPCAIRIAFEHELAHILLGHLNRNVKIKTNRETQASFLASLMVDSQIYSLHTQYLSYFRPAEYQRTLLYHNDFKTQDLQEALYLVLDTLYE